MSILLQGNVYSFTLFKNNMLDCPVLLLMYSIRLRKFSIMKMKLGTCIGCRSAGLTRLYLAFFDSNKIVYVMHMECTLPQVHTFAAFVNLQLVSCVCVRTCFNYSLYIYTSNHPLMFLRNGLQYGELNSMYTFQSNFNLSLILLGICISPRLPT